MIKNLKTLLSHEFYLEDKYVYYVMFLVKIKVSELGEIAVSPNCYFTQVLAKKIFELFGINLIVLDQNPVKMDDFVVDDISSVDKFILKKIYIFSPSHFVSIEEQIRKHLKKPVEIKNSEKLLEEISFREIRSLGSFLNYYKILSEKKILELYSSLSKNKIMFVSETGIYDVYEKTKIASKIFNCNIIYINKSSIKINDLDVKINFLDVIIFLMKMRKIKKYYFFITHNPLNHTLVFLLRYYFVNSKIISYEYDYLLEFCPYEDKKYAKEYLNLDDNYCESEYKFASKMLIEKVSDLIIYKDGGNNYELFHKALSPSLFFPAYLKKELFLTPILRDENLKYKFVFIGTLLSPKLHTVELSGSNFFPDFFNAFIEQGCSVDVYSPTFSEEVVNYYRSYCVENKNLNLLSFHQGSPLHKLLPKIKDLYGWGLVLQKDIKKNKKLLYKNAFPAKIMTYIALGLPIIISDMILFSANFVKEHDIGVVVSENEMHKIRDIISTVDYLKLVKNVIFLRNKFSLENNINTLQSTLYDIEHKNV